MKPTPTPDVINLVVAAREFWDANNDLSDESHALDKALEAFSGLVPYENEPHDAALSVQPAAAVVGEPVAWTTETNLAVAKHDPELALTMWGKPTGKEPVALYREPPSAPSAPDGWQPIETAPKDGTEILAYGYARCDGSRYANGQHIAWWDAELGWTGRDPDDRVTLHLSHWRPLPPRPELGGE